MGPPTFKASFTLTTRIIASIAGCAQRASAMKALAVRHNITRVVAGQVPVDRCHPQAGAHAGIIHFDKIQAVNNMATPSSGFNPALRSTPG